MALSLRAVAGAERLLTYEAAAGAHASQHHLAAFCSARSGSMSGGWQ
jgi:hypothetical protein